MDAKYLKTWSGVTSGTYAGRDDGYPEMKSKIYSSFNELAKEYGTQKNEIHYKLQNFNLSELEVSVQNSLIEQAGGAKQRKKAKLREDIEKLQAQLKSLE